MAVAHWFAALLEMELKPWVSLSTDQICLLWDHYEILLRWNERMNLTSVPPGRDMVLRHYCESLFFGAHVPWPEEPATIADLGSGAGFPGVPLAVWKPSWRVTLLESNQRKAVFLRESTRGLGNVSVRADRAESLSEKFDWLVARGVDPKDVLRNMPHLAPRVALMLGQDDFSSILPSSHIAWLEPIRLPWGDRRLCVYGEVPRET